MDSPSCPATGELGQDCHGITFFIDIWVRLYSDAVQREASKRFISLYKDRDATTILLSLSLHICRSIAPSASLYRGFRSP